MTPVGLARAYTLCLCGQSRRKQVVYKGTSTAEGQLQSRYTLYFGFLTGVSYNVLYRKHMPKLFHESSHCTAAGRDVAYRGLYGRYTVGGTAVCSLCEFHTVGAMYKTNSR